MITFPESHRDLLAADVATLSTIGRDGQPRSPPSGFCWTRTAR